MNDSIILIQDVYAVAVTTLWQTVDKKRPMTCVTEFNSDGENSVYVAVSYVILSALIKRRFICIIRIYLLPLSSIFIKWRLD